jgi:cell division protein FtsA
VTTRSEIVVAVDIGTTKVCTLIGDVRGEDHIEILGAGLAPSHGMRKGVVVDISATTSAVRQSVAAAAAAADVHVEHVYVGVTGEHIASLTSRGCVAVDDEIQEEHLQKAEATAGQVILPPDREVLHNIPRQYIVDGQEGVRHPVGMSASRLEVESHVVTAATAFLENVAKCVQRAGLEIEDLVVEPLATGLAVLTDAERQLGVLLADIGGGTTDVALFNEGAITHTTIVPVGGSHVTQDLAVAFRIDPEQAERLKLASGVVSGDDLENLAANDEYVQIRMIGEEEAREIPRALLAQVIGPRMEELFELLREHVEKAAGDGIYANSCVLSGGGSQVPGAVAMAERVLGMPVRLGRPREIIDPGGLAATPAHATAVGLLAFAARYHHPRRRPRSQEPKSITAAALGLIAGWFRRLRRPKKRPPRSG